MTAPAVTDPTEIVLAATARMVIDRVVTGLSEIDRTAIAPMVIDPVEIVLMETDPVGIVLTGTDPTATDLMVTDRREIRDRRAPTRETSTGITSLTADKADRTVSVRIDR
jgi:hypothetical protein